MDYSAYVVPLLLAFVALFALAERVNVYEALTRGASQGLSILGSILPALVGLMTAVYMLRASGAMEALGQLLAPVLIRLGIPREGRQGLRVPAGLWQQAAENRPEQAAETVGEAAGVHHRHNTAPKAQDPRHGQAQLHRRAGSLQGGVPHRRDGAVEPAVDHRNRHHPRPHPGHRHTLHAPPLI